MNYYDKIVERWSQELLSVESDENNKLLFQNDISIGQYKSYLVETFKHVRENPYSQMISATKIPKDNHEFLKKYVSHLQSEISHDLLAMNDYLFLGGKKEYLLEEPLPKTSMLIKFTYNIANSNTVIPYLGYLFHVELMPIKSAGRYIDMLKAKGVPEDGYTFLEEHAKVDVFHHNLMKYYINQSIVDERTFEEFVEHMIQGMRIHSDMIVGALKRSLD